MMLRIITLLRLLVSVHTLWAGAKVAPSRFCCLPKIVAAVGSAFALSGVPVPSRAEEMLNKVTAVAKLDVSILRQPARSLEVQLYGEAAPESTRRFLSFCSGDNDYNSAGLPFTYDGAQVSRIIKGREIEVGKFASGKSKKLATKMNESGKVSLSTINLGDDLTPTKDELGLVPIDKGIVTVPKRGGTFSFVIHSNEEPDGDAAKSRVAIGKITNTEGLGVIDDIDKIPVSREDALGTKGAFSSAGKGFDPRAKLASVNRPLQRVEVVRCSVSDKASLSSFLKF